MNDLVQMTALDPPGYVPPPGALEIFFLPSMFSPSFDKYFSLYADNLDDVEHLIEDGHFEGKHMIRVAGRPSGRKLSEFEQEGLRKIFAPLGWRYQGVSQVWRRRT